MIGIEFENSRNWGHFRLEGEEFLETVTGLPWEEREAQGFPAPPPGRGSRAGLQGLSVGRQSTLQGELTVKGETQFGWDVCLTHSHCSGKMLGLLDTPLPRDPPTLRAGLPLAVRSTQKKDL